MISDVAIPDVGEEVIERGQVAEVDIPGDPLEFRGDVIEAAAPFFALA